jgi:hypothetical protein
MTVETITMEEIRERNTGKHNSDGFRFMAGVFISNESLANVEPDIWRFIRDELNDMPDMKYSCQYETLGDEAGKRLWIISETMLLSEKAVEFLEGTIERNSTVSAACITDTSAVSVAYVQLEEGANCPLFSK